jgi:hypothetical protein
MEWATKITYLTKGAFRFGDIDKLFVITWFIGQFLKMYLGNGLAHLAKQ